MARVRLIDIADAAGVSMTTASYVINRRPVAIPKETRQRILQIARDLNYQPNQMARNLAQGTSGLIGVLTPINGSPFHARLMAELNEHAGAMSLKVVFEPVARESGDAAQQRAIDRLLQWRVDGLLLWCDRPFCDVKADCPVISMGPFQSPKDERPHVAIDLYSGARQAAQHLIALGHRDVCFVGHREDEADPRWEATRDALADAGLPTPLRLGNSYAETDFRSAASSLARRGATPSAFLCISDVQAMAVFRGLRDAGLRIPEDVSIVSCDQTWVAEHVDPPLTAVSIPFGDMTKLAFDTLLSLIRGEKPEPLGASSGPVLHVRGSTAPPK